MVNLWLIRHGESDANAGLVTSNPIDIQLTAKGYKQAKSLARLWDAAPALIITSPFLRTKQTAQPLLEKFMGTLEAEWPIEEFTYLSPVRFKNTAVHERRPAAKAYWQIADPLHVDGEGAESFADFMGRVRNFYGQVAQLGDGFVVAFTHEKFMQGVLWSLLSAPSAINSETMAAYRHFTDSFSIPNGAFIRLNITENDIYFSNIMTAHLPKPE